MGPTEIATQEEIQLSEYSVILTFVIDNEGVSIYTVQKGI